MSQQQQQQVFVVIGASRGIGFEYIKQLATRTPTPIVYATVRNPTSTTELNNYASTHSNVKVLSADLASAESFVKAAETISKQVDGVDVLIVNGAQWTSGKLLEDSDKDITHLFDVNALGPIRALRAFLPLLRKRNTKKVVFVSSSAGSIALNDPALVGLFATHQVPYGTSKAALNSLTHQAANDLKPEGFTVIPLCPGMVRTEMGEFAMSHYPPELIAGLTSVLTEKPEFGIQTPAESVERQLKVIDGLTVADTGKFFAHTGAINPW